MLALSSGYLGHLASDTTQLAHLWTITRRDGAIYRFTNHDSDLIAGGETYRAAAYRGAAIVSRADLSVDNTTVSAVFDSAAITEADLRAGIWDNAQIILSECVWSDTGLGIRTLRSGRLGQVTYDGVAWRAEILGLMQALQGNVGRLITPSCDAILGDARCGVVLAPFTHAMTVTAVTDRARFTAAGLAQAAGYFSGGLVEWTAGANAGARSEIKRHESGGVLTMFLPPSRSIVVGDTGSIVAGCDKMLATCDGKFANVPNFRGFPHVPGNDRTWAPRSSR